MGCKKIVIDLDQHESAREAHNYYWAKTFFVTINGLKIKVNRYLTCTQLIVYEPFYSDRYVWYLRSAVPSFWYLILGRKRAEWREVKKLLKIYGY